MEKPICLLIITAVLAEFADAICFLWFVHEQTGSWFGASSFDLFLKYLKTPYGLILTILAIAPWLLVLLLAQRLFRSD